MNGKLYYNESKYADTDKKPRRALPLAGDALPFSRQCAAIKSPYQAQAQKNVLTITKEYRGLK